MVPIPRLEFIDSAFDNIKDIDVLSQECVSLSSSKRKNRDRSIGGVELQQRKKIGYRCDMIFCEDRIGHDDYIEYGASEAGKLYQGEEGHVGPFAAYKKRWVKYTQPHGNHIDSDDAATSQPNRLDKSFQEDDTNSIISVIPKEFRQEIFRIALRILAEQQDLSLLPNLQGMVDGFTPRTIGERLDVMTAMLSSEKDFKSNADI
ncbi:hypothetical protein G6F62_003661 [Rhizopus arrhizus]|nr:hypothetical protein G6F62_003661 [Rhizopus arrhizus]